ncbi:aspartate kinase [Ascoidea rubescens DSM 1968]|uniref:Aspartokinase n=1 Tax=Ascoidea rubescens DSM 1968 TaxID=1344418 RepID=A0A1D2VGG4_9ASCO|nr:aspartate kinase [Ascoidea rubescens DSM 1968]ODV60754.1 aspartate kinase [Ascoidea rubescens DSM 1968]
MSLRSFPSNSSINSVVSNGWVVQKFGGTSVGKFPEKIADDIIKLYSYTNKVAVVCSARSSTIKTEGTTSRLLLAANYSIENKDYKKIIDLVLKDHFNNANKKIVNNAEIRKELIEQTKSECDQVLKLLHASTVIGELSSKTLDSIIALGEKLSCLFISALLNDRGVNAQYIDLSTILLNSNNNNGSNSSISNYSNGNKFNDDFSLDQDFYNNLAKKLANKIKFLPDGVVPVLTGYFGPVPGGLLNGIGRGYTDLCAALVAVGVYADELQIWKEVDGIFTADPRKVKNARLLDSVTPEEAAELTYYGSEVIHPFTMEQVIKAKIPIRIKNVENPTGKGTIIYPDNIGRKGESTPPHPPIASNLIPGNFFIRTKGPTAVTIKHNIIVLNVHSNKKILSHGFLASIFQTLDKYRLVVDLISTSEVYVSMALYHTFDEENELKLAISELTKYGTVDIVRDMAIISLVGKQMKQFIGIASQMFQTLAEQNINIEMISQGSNEINISCVINEADSLRALQAIHAKLLDRPTVVDQRLAALKLSAY